MTTFYEDFEFKKEIEGKIFKVFAEISGEYNAKHYHEEEFGSWVEIDIAEYNEDYLGLVDEWGREYEYGDEVISSDEWEILKVDLYDCVEERLEIREEEE